jgi:rod shape-determining protein MreC
MAVLSQRRRRAVVLLALATVFVITLDLGGGAGAAAARGIVSGLFSPVERVMRVVTRPIGDVWRAVGEYDALLEENRILREKVAQQEGAAIAAAASVRLSQELLALNGLPTLAGINSVSAQVIGEAPSNLSATVEINQGSDSGIRVGMPVLNAAGLVGRITRVERERAVVMLISDPNYAVSVKIVDPPDPEDFVAIGPELPDPDATTTTLPRPVATTAIPGFTPGEQVVASTVPQVIVDVPSLTVPAGTADSVRETGIFEGKGFENLPEVRFIENTKRFGEVKVGSPIVTAGGSQSLAPPDIVIGTVLNPVGRAGVAGNRYVIQITADLKNLSFVRILLYQPITERGAAAPATTVAAP